MATRTDNPDIDNPDIPQTPRAGRPARSGHVRRILLTTAAAAMLVVPTACGYAAAADRISTGHGAPAVPAADQQDQQGTGAQQQGRGQQRADQAGTTAGTGQNPNGGNEPATPGGDQGAKANQDKQNAQGDQNAQGAKGAKGDPAAQGAAGGAQGGAQKINGLDVLARDCANSKLPPHDGFQKGDRCVSTAFGEVGNANQNPSLLITKFPETVQANQPFSIDVTTRNLKRDRFLGAAAGGYYLESSLLDDNGIQRGHFHTACRMISEDVAPAPGDKPAFFVATQDNKGGAGESTVTINVTGLPKGIAQCSSWAGDGSHRIPMMERADQTPAFDSVRIRVV